MVNTGVRLEINPDIIEKLSSGKRELWSAVHDDGTNNRINGDVVLHAASYGMVFGFLATAAQ